MQNLIICLNNSLPPHAWNPGDNLDSINTCHKSKIIFVSQPDHEQHCQQHVEHAQCNICQKPNRYIVIFFGNMVAFSSLVDEKALLCWVNWFCDVEHKICENDASINNGIAHEYARDGWHIVVKDFEEGYFDISEIVVNWPWLPSFTTDFYYLSIKAYLAPFKPTPRPNSLCFVDLFRLLWLWHLLLFGNHTLLTASELADVGIGYVILGGVWYCGYGLL